MSIQTRAFRISLLFHGLIIALFLFLGSRIGPSRKLMIMDFTLNKAETPAKKVEPVLPRPVPPKKELTSEAPQGAKKNEPPKPPAEKLETAPSPEIPPVVKLPETQNPGGGSLNLGMVSGSKSVKEGTSGSSGIAGGSGEGSGTGRVGNGGGTGGSGEGKESAARRYLREHFAYIRDKIIGNISYPPLARRMGWQGKVILSFIITTDGFVREVKIVQSSGFAVLDKNAAETISDTAPFPKPPIEAQLIIPIVYRLE